MSYETETHEDGKRQSSLESRFYEGTFPRPHARPTILGLAGLAGSTWITCSYIANWWDGSESPIIFFSFVWIFGGLLQFISGVQGFQARDTLATVINTMWGSFWMSIGVVYALLGAGALEPDSVHEHSLQLASWFFILCLFTWSSALAAYAHDIMLSGCLSSLAIGSTIACCLFYYYGAGLETAGCADGQSRSVTTGIKVATYFWMLAALLAWCRVITHLVEEAFDPGSWIDKFLPSSSTSLGRRAPSVTLGPGDRGEGWPADKH